MTSSLPRLQPATVMTAAGDAGRRDRHRGQAGDFAEEVTTGVYDGVTA
ncbi:MAG: hypothetical protein GY719_21375 [bacterium]|nr:hypothetical protein [bacterium]